MYSSLKKYKNITFKQNIETVCDLLQDERSKNILEDRFQWYSTRDAAYIRKLVHSETNFDSCIRFRNEYAKLYNQPVVICGIGADGTLAYKLLAENKRIKIAYFCDQRYKEISLYNNIQVIGIEQAVSIENALFIVSSTYYKSAIKNELIEKGIDSDNIIVLNGDWQICTMPNQYFDNDIIQLRDGEVFIDCGAADGVDTWRFLRKAGIDSSSYMIEPLKSNVELLQKKFYGVENCHIIQAGVWSRNGILYFSEGEGSFSGRIIEQPSNNCEDVKVIAIDELNIKEKITYIKMDIEGSELEALHGAEKTIVKDKPKLAICVYHKPEHLYEIPLYIKKLVPEYKLYLRHYANYDCETVLYAVL